MIVVISTNILWVPGYTQIGRIIVSIRVNINAGYSYRIRVAHIINHFKFIRAAFLNFQVVNITVLIKVEVVDMIIGVVNPFFEYLRIGACFNQLCQFVYIKTGWGIVALDSYIILLRRILIAGRSKQYYRC